MRPGRTQTSVEAVMGEEAWTLAELEAELARFETELRAAGKAEPTVHTYVERSARFIKWLAGEYDPKAR